VAYCYTWSAMVGLCQSVRHICHNDTVDDTAYYSTSVPLWTQTTVADGHKGFK